jgi:hypothetical protein
MQLQEAPPLGVPRKKKLVVFKISMFSFITCALTAFKSIIRVVRAHKFTSVLHPDRGKRLSLLQAYKHWP